MLELAILCTCDVYELFPCVYVIGIVTRCMRSDMTLVHICTLNTKLLVILNIEPHLMAMNFFL